MRDRHVSPRLVTGAMSVLLTVLFAAPAPAAKWRESNLAEGWQIWISTADFDRRDDKQSIKLGKEAQGLAAGIPAPVLGADVIMASQRDGFMDYDFESSQEGTVHIYARVMQLGGRGQSWFVVLNSEIPNWGVVFATIEEWKWQAGKPRLSPVLPLKKGRNTVRVIPREAAAGKEILMDIFVVSTQPFEPNDNAYKKAKRKQLAVQPAGKLATTWAALKRDF